MKKEIIPVKGTPAVPRFQFVETGLYRNKSNGVYFERPSIKGRRTWRSLDTANLKHAREELYRRRAGVRAVEVEKAKAAVTVGDIARHYQKDGYPDRQKQPRVGRTLVMEKPRSPRTICSMTVCTRTRPDVRVSARCRWPFAAERCRRFSANFSRVAQFWLVNAAASSSAVSLLLFCMRDWLMQKCLKRFWRTKNGRSSAENRPCGWRPAVKVTREKTPAPPRTE